MFSTVSQSSYRYPQRAASDPGDNPPYAQAIPMQAAAHQSIAEAAAHRHRKRAPKVKAAVTAAPVQPILDRYDGSSE